MPLSTIHLRPHSLTTLTAALLALSGCGVNLAEVEVEVSVFGDAWESVECSTFELPEEVAAMSDCGYVTVPERHGQPDGNTIELAVVRTRSTGDSPAPDPLFVAQGGPGNSTIGAFPQQALPAIPVYTTLLESRDLVFVEERGTQYSRPFVACPEQTDHNIAVAKGERSPEDTAWMVACRDRSLSEGINLDAFNTVENAADMYAVAEALSYDQFNYYGVSYGTLLGQYVMAQAEEHDAQLRSVILDGVVTPDIDFNLAFSQTMSQAARNLFAACAADPQCNEAYPNLETVFLSLLDRLEQEPVPVTLTVPSTGETIETTLDRGDFVEVIEGAFVVSGAAPQLPQIIYQAAEGDFSKIVEKMSEGLESSSASGMYHTVVCSRANSIQVEPTEVFAEAPYEQLIPYGISESAEVTQFCDILQVEMEEPFAYDNTNIPTLVLNGGYDPITPEAYGKIVASNLETASVYTFPGVGHGSLNAIPETPAANCVETVVTDFLSEPEQTPDDSCVADVEPIFAYP